MCSFGLLLFELLAGRRFGISCCNDEALQPDWVKSSVEQNLLIRIVDKTLLAERISQKQFLDYAMLGLSCISNTADIGQQ